MQQHVWDKNHAKKKYYNFETKGKTGKLYYNEMNNKKSWKKT